MQFWCMRMVHFKRVSVPNQNRFASKTLWKRPLEHSCHLLSRSHQSILGKHTAFVSYPFQMQLQVGILRQQEVPSPSVPTLSGRRRHDSTTLRATLEAWAVVALQSSDENAKHDTSKSDEHMSDFQYCNFSENDVQYDCRFALFDFTVLDHPMPDIDYSPSLLPLSQAAQVWGSQLVRRPAQHSQKPHLPPGIANNRWMNFCCMPHFQFPGTVTISIE